jgi:hypothetical protein
MCKMDQLKWEGRNIRSHVTVRPEINDTNLMGAWEHRLSVGAQDTLP